MRRIAVLLFTLVLGLMSVGMASAQTQPIATVVTDALNVRTAPTTQAGVFAVIGQGDAHQVVGRTADASWWLLSLRPTGIQGWVSGGYIQVANAQFVPVVASPAPTAPTFLAGRVNTGRLNIRATPDPYFGQILTTVSQGDVLTVSAKTATAPVWYFVQNPLGGGGWVNARYLDVPNAHLIPVSGGMTPTPAPTPAPIPPTYGTVVNAYFLNVRTTPNPYIFNVITIVARNQTFPVIGRNTDASWYQIVLPNGIAGWVRSKYFSVVSPATLPITG